jgi:hypothetical protein
MSANLNATTPFGTTATPSYSHAVLLAGIEQARR